MFLGSHTISMDAKGRIAVPSRIRELLMAACEGRFVMTANPSADAGERCLAIYPEGYWDDVMSRLNSLHNTNKVVRRTQRLMMGYATMMEMDGNGRVLVPPTLREYAGLDKQLIMVGQGSKLELWSEERWNTWLDDVDGSDEMPAEMLNLSL